MKNLWAPLILILVLVALIMFVPVYGWRLNRFLGRSTHTTTDVIKLTLENQNLKAELAKLEKVKSVLPENTRGFILGIVYSRYPFNFRNQFLISAGRAQGVLQSAGVTFGGVLIGKATKVFDDTTLVRTVFDSEFQTPVRVGSAGIEALFKGGNLPKVTLIPEKSEIRRGDIVYTSSPDFPYGIPVGEVGEVTASADQLFKEATIAFAYDVNAIQAVLIAK